LSTRSQLTREALALRCCIGTWLLDVVTMCKDKLRQGSPKRPATQPRKAHGNATARLGRFTTASPSGNKSIVTTPLLGHGYAVAMSRGRERKYSLTLPMPKLLPLMLALSS
jgi:hypothetical protein